MTDYLVTLLPPKTYITLDFKNTIIFSRKEDQVSDTISQAHINLDKSNNKKIQRSRQINDTQHRINATVVNWFSKVINRSRKNKYVT